MADIHNINGKDVEVDIMEDEELQDLLHGKLVILQKKEGYRFSVDPILLTSFVDYRKGEKIMDLGTGSGIIPLILAHKKPNDKAEIVGLEIQEEMADMAERSVAANRMEDEITIQHGDICRVRKDFTADSFDVVISNPPYIACAVLDTLDPEVREHEPRLALDGGEDGLDPYPHLFAEARRLLAPGGTGVFEIGYDQGEAALGLAETAGFGGATVRHDLAGHDRAVVIQSPARE